ncbi:unnamed protein product [Discosporangium mesarthrocarpum]
MTPKGWRVAAEAALLAVVFIHVLLCPFTKVEESFNLQARCAIHDILVHQGDLSQYDHFEFPGVVPRTFLGAITVAAASAPAHAAVSLLGLPRLVSQQVAARLALGFGGWLCFRRMNAAVGERFGQDAAAFSALVWLCQSHLPFYLSRTLPNTFALCAANLAYEALLRGRVPRALGLLAAATVVFRCDLLVLLAPLTLQLLVSQ